MSGGRRRGRRVRGCRERGRGRREAGWWDRWRVGWAAEASKRGGVANARRPDSKASPGAER